jgi:hypothetical protein
MLSDKKILFLTPNKHVGKINRNFTQMRVEFAWICALNATHHPIFNIDKITESFDIIFFTLPKLAMEISYIINHFDLIEELKQRAKYIYFIQEGPVRIYHDLPPESQLWYYYILNSVDGIFAHNINDKKYYDGILMNENIKVYNILSTMIEDNIKDIDKNKKEEKVIIGGNFVSWYGGWDSLIVTKEINLPTYAPLMGRKQSNEEKYINHIPYKEWTDWMKILSTFKYAVHLMPTFAAGTFAMNCGYLGIPCIGYDYVDTQKNIHPNLSININDIGKAKKLIYKLKNNKKYYDEQSKLAIENYNKFHSENVFIKYMNDLNLGEVNG